MAIIVKGERAFFPPSTNATVSAVQATSSGLARPATVSGGSSRNPLQQPFASTSIWNMPIGTGAVYAACNYTSNPHNSASMPIPYNDNEQICLTPTAPLTAIRYSSAGFSGGNRCNPTNNPPSYIQDPFVTDCPIPTSYVHPSDTQNSQGVFLKADGRTLYQFLCFTRCVAGGVPTAYLQDPGSVKHVPFLPNEDLYGSGIHGSHGASGLSSLGGTLRLGEMRPGQATGPKHALKIDVDPTAMLHKPTSLTDAYRWPANKADSYWGAAGSGYGQFISAPVACKMGALLAIPTSVNINSLGFETTPGLMLAWTLQNYGAYIVDSTGGASISMCTEEGYHGSFTAQFQSDWGFPWLARQSPSTAWGRDFVRCYTHFSVVDNNSPTSIGGGGTPLQPLAPDIGSGP